MKFILIILISVLCTRAFGQDSNEDSRDTADFYLMKPGILLRSNLTNSDVVGSFRYHWNMWDYTTIHFSSDGQFEQRSWINCSYDRPDDSGSWRLVDSRTIEISSDRQQIRFNFVQAEGLTFLVPYSRSMEFIRTVETAREVKRGDIEGMDRDELFFYLKDGGLWKKAFYRKL